MSIPGAQKKGESAAAQLLKAIKRFQGRLSVRITSIAADIRTDAAGNILATPENIGRVNELVGRMKADFLDPEFVADVRKYIGSMDDVTGQVIAAFKDFDGLKSEILRAVDRQMKLQAEIDLTNAEAYNEVLWNELGNSMISGTARGLPLESTVGQIADIMRAEPITVRAAGYAESAPITLQRTATLVAAEQTGAQFFFFQGRPIKTTRPWCREREGKFWHIEEIRKWGRDAAAGKGWAGMVAGTNEETIFIHLGGWFGDRDSCRHVLTPVPRFRVPKADLDRMREAGYIE